MAQLAILGHPTRGNEVIEILEMLGGKIRRDRLAGNELFSWYYINGNGYIDYKHYSLFDDTMVFTLEEFIEKFPYKVGDKVIAYVEECLAQFTIQDMRWNYKLNTVEYKICSSRCDTSLTQPYKQETMDKAVFDANAQCCDISNRLIKEETMEEKSATINRVCSISKCKTTGQGTFAIKIADGYKFDSIDENGNIIVKPIKPQYPRTYEECCKVLNISYPYFKTEEDGVSASTYKNELFGALKQLIICRDAYWKISGDWKIDFDSKMYYISNEYGEMQKSEGTTDYNVILAFPTKEMRDAFFENFKDLIERCKELL